MRSGGGGCRRRGTWGWRGGRKSPWMRPSEGAGEGFELGVLERFKEDKNAVGRRELGE